MKTITLAFTGASGLPYGMRLLECLLASGQRVHLVYSQAAQIVAKQELDFTLPNRPQDAEQMFAERFGKLSGELKVFGTVNGLVAARFMDNTQNHPLPLDGGGDLTQDAKL